MRTSRNRFLPLLALILACSEPTSPVALGVWGGPVASLSLSRTGGALSYLCGAGTMDGRWTLSGDGLLSGTGQHYFGGGPVPAEGRAPHPARYSGLIEGDTMILTVTLTETGQTLGPFSLRRGGPVVQELWV